MNSPKLKGSLAKRLDKDEINGIQRLHIQLSYSSSDSSLNSFGRKKSGNYNGRE